MLEKGATLTVQTDDEWKEKCDKDNLYMDYKNLPKVMTVGGLIFVDDGLISLKVPTAPIRTPPAAPRLPHRRTHCTLCTHCTHATHATHSLVLATPLVAIATLGLRVFCLRR